MSYFGDHFWGDKNSGFAVLYHNMKHGQLSIKELAEFVRERAAVEEAYSKSMQKLSKMVNSGSHLGTFAPMWEMFRVSSDKLALCHLELSKKLHDLIKDIHRYGDEQVKVHKKAKEEMSGTLEVIQLLQCSSQFLQKSRDNYCSRFAEQERLRREGAPQKEMDKAKLKTRKAAESLRGSVEKYNAVRKEFEEKMLQSAQLFQDTEAAHLTHMKRLVTAYSHSVEDTHVQIGQVQEEFKHNMENVAIEKLIRKFAENNGTGTERPEAVEFEGFRFPASLEGVKRTWSKPFRIRGLSKREKDTQQVESTEPNCVDLPDIDEEGFTIRPDDNIGPPAFQDPDKRQTEQETLETTEKSNLKQPETKMQSLVKMHVPMKSKGDPSVPCCSSSDSDFDDDDNEEPRRFRIQIKPPQSGERGEDEEAEMKRLRETVGCMIQPPAAVVSVRRQTMRTVIGAGASPGETQILCQTDKSALGFSNASPSFETNSCDTNSVCPTHPAHSSFGPLQESVFEPEDFPVCRTYTLTSSPSPFSSSSPENVEDSGLDSPFHPFSGPSPDSRPWTPRDDSSTGDSVLVTSSFADSPADLTSSNSIEHPTERSDTWEQKVTAPSPPVPSCTSVRTTELFSPNCDSWDSSSGFHTTRTQATCIAPRAQRSNNMAASINLSLLTPGPPSAPSERGFFSPPSLNAGFTLGLSRGPSPVILGSQESLPVAAAFTEYVHAVFDEGALEGSGVRVSGELTMSFPGGILRVFGGSTPPPVLSFRLVNTSNVEHFIPNCDLLYSDLSQSDSSCKDFWLNMPRLTCHLQNLAEQHTAPYYNVVLLKYQVFKPGIAAAPLYLSSSWNCSPTSTEFILEYKQNISSLNDLHILLPLDEPISNLQFDPPARCQFEVVLVFWEKILLESGRCTSAVRCRPYLCEAPRGGCCGRSPTHSLGMKEKLNCIRVTLASLLPTALPDWVRLGEGCGRLYAHWQPLGACSTSCTAAAQFTCEGRTLSGVDIELVGSGYRMSLVKKRFAAGKYLVC